MFMHVHQQRIQCVERQKKGLNSGKGSREHAGSYLLNRHHKCRLSSNHLDSFHGSRVRKKTPTHSIGLVAGAVLMWWTCPCWEQGEDQAGAQAGKHPAVSHRGQARDHVPWECPCQESRRSSTSNPPPQLWLQKSGFTTVWQDRLYLHSHIRNPAGLYDAVYSVLPQLTYSLQKDFFVTTVAGATYTIKRLF